MSHNCLQPRSRVIVSQNVRENTHIRVLAKFMFKHESPKGGLLRDSTKRKSTQLSTIQIQWLKTRVDKCVKCPNS